MNFSGATGIAGAADFAALAPEILLTVAGSVILLLEAFAPRLRAAFTGLAVLSTAAAAWLAWELPAGPSFGGLLVADRLTAVGSLIVLVSAGLALLASQGFLKRESILGGEYHALFLWCAAGMLVMLRSAELLTVFVSLELLSLCLYALAAYHRKVVVGSEAALKYFLMGAFASSFVLYGIALLYGATGSTYFAGIAAGLAGAGAGAALASPWLGAIGVLLLVAGFGFKMSIAPFHAWAPDTYQGAPSPFVAFLSVAPKAASAFVLIRVLATVFPDAAGTPWPAVVATLAVVSMVVGNLLALVQDDIKRMLAYSGVGHMGYLLIPLAGLDLAPAGDGAGGTWSAVLVYLAAYALMNAGAFGIVAMLYGRPGEQHLISELSGWGYRYPLLGAALTVCMLSLGGIPPTLGFVGKYLVFLHAIRHGQTWLALVGVATSIVGVFYYLRVVYYLYMKEEVHEPAGLLIDGWGKTAAVLAALGTLAFGVYPAWLLGWIG